MNDDSSTATNDEPVENPNELGTEMTEAEEQAFVNKTLGIEDKDEPGEGSSEKKDDEPVEPVPTEEEAPAEPETEKPPAPAETGEELPGEAAEVREEDSAAASKQEDEPAAELEGPQTDDLWIEVEKIVTDKDGNETVELAKLTYDPANPGAFLPDDFRFKNDKQLFEVLDAKSEMGNLYRQRLTEFENKTEESKAKADKIQADKDVQTSWDNEIQSLIDAGILEAPKAKPGDKGFLEDPAVQKLDEVFKYMAAENTKRSEDGKPLLRSFGTALNLMTKEVEAKAETDKKKQDNKLAKERASLVGGTSSNSSSDGPTYTRGSASNIWGVKVPD